MSSRQQGKPEWLRGRVLHWAQGCLAGRRRIFSKNHSPVRTPDTVPQTRLPPSRLSPTGSPLHLPPSLEMLTLGDAGCHAVRKPELAGVEGGPRWAASINGPTRMNLQMIPWAEMSPISPPTEPVSLTNPVSGSPWGDLLHSQNKGTRHPALDREAAGSGTEESPIPLRQALGRGGLGGGEGTCQRGRQGKDSSRVTAVNPVCLQSFVGMPSPKSEGRAEKGQVLQPWNQSPGKPE